MPAVSVFRLLIEAFLQLLRLETFFRHTYDLLGPVTLRQLTARALDRFQVQVSSRQAPSTARNGLIGLEHGAHATNAEIARNRKRSSGPRRRTPAPSEPTRRREICPTMTSGPARRDRRV